MHALQMIFLTNGMMSVAVLHTVLSVNLIYSSNKGVSEISIVGGGGELE